MTERIEATSPGARYTGTRGKTYPEGVLAIWLTPQCIRDHFDYPDDPVAEYVQGLCEAQLVDIGIEAIDDERFWETFHAVLVDVINEKRDAR